MNSGNIRFNELADYYICILEKMYAFLSKNMFRYGFVIPEQYETLAKADIASALRIYWQEILLMTHMASVTSLLRSRSWLIAACHAIEEGNSLAFAGCFRAFLEAASDTFDALGNVPETLVENREPIKQHLAKQYGPVLQIKGFEDQLIHFLRAREISKGESTPASHHKKQAAVYFETLDKSRRGPVRELYRELCELSHPSEGSVSLFLENQPDGYQLLKPVGDPNYFYNLAVEHRDAVETAFECGINVCLIALKVLNEFPMKNLHTPLLEHIYFDNLSVGGRIRSRLRKKRW